MKRWLLVCECGVIAVGEEGARCNHDRRRSIDVTCPTRWELWAFTGKTEPTEWSAS